MVQVFVLVTVLQPVDGRAMRRRATPIRRAFWPTGFW